MSQMTLVRGIERRAHRRHDLLSREVPVTTPGIPVNGKRGPVVLGHLVDVSAGGIRMRADKDQLHKLRLKSQIEVTIELPAFAGISAFVDRSGPQIRPTRTWTGTMTVTRLSSAGEDEIDIGARLDSIDALDQGMLSLYLSTQPLAA